MTALDYIVVVAIPAALAIAFVVALKMGRIASRYALLACLCAFVAAALVARADLSERASAQTLDPSFMWSAFAATIIFRLALVLTGPALFDRWPLALAASIGLNVAAFFVPAWIWTFLVLGVTSPVGAR